MQTLLSPQVLIVGAGPTGLALAGILGRLNVRVRIIEKNSNRSDKSKALGVHAGTLESIEQVFGPEVSQAMVAQGFPAQKAFVHIDQKDPILADLSTIPSPYNFVLILGQSETERLLEEQLARFSISVERQTEVISVHPTDTQVHCEIRKKDGTVEKLSSDFLVGCDGAHSTVRTQVGIPFKGGSYEGDFILGDVKVQWPWAYGTVRLFISRAGVMACFPMKGVQRYRFVLIPRGSISALKPEISFEEFRSTVATLCHQPVELSDPVWLTRFHVHHRMTRTFQEGRVFLAGDAAHIHSPAGGQGMNTGIQDAFNIGYKIAQVIHHGADLNLLKQYTQERLPVARQVLCGTDIAFRFVLLNENHITRWLRDCFYAKVIKTRWIQKKVAAAISEVGIARREIRNRSMSV